MLSKSGNICSSFSSSVTCQGQSLEADNENMMDQHCGISYALPHYCNEIASSSYYADITLRSHCCEITEQT